MSATDGSYLEARLLAILLAFPNLIEQPEVAIDVDWFLVREHARIFAELKKHRTNDVMAFELTREERNHALTLLLYESFVPENLFAYVEALKERAQRLAFADSTRKLTAPRGNGRRLFEDIP